MFEMRTSAWALGPCAPGPPRDPQEVGPSAGIHPAAGTAVSSSVGAPVGPADRGRASQRSDSGWAGEVFRGPSNPCRRGAERAGGLSEMIITLEGREGGQLHVLMLLVMCIVLAHGMQDSGGSSVFVVISSIHGVAERWCAAVRARWAQPRSAGVATDAPVGVSRPEVRRLRGILRPFKLTVSTLRSTMNRACSRHGARKRLSQLVFRTLAARPGDRTRGVL